MGIFLIVIGMISLIVSAGHLMSSINGTHYHIIEAFILGVGGFIQIGIGAVINQQKKLFDFLAKQQNPQTGGQNTQTRA